MVTFGDIFNKLKTEIFSDASNEEFYINCKQRENEIKKALKMSFKSFNTHIRKFNENKEHLTKWQIEKVKSCGANLADYMDYLVNLLDKNKIEEYCKSSNKIPHRFIPFISDIILLMVNSYQGAIQTDLHWVSDLTVGDSINISIGDFDFNKLKKYLPSRINNIQNLCKEIKHIEYIHSRINSINEAILCYKNGHLKACHLLLITTIEGLVRSLGVLLVEKQQLEINPLDKRKYASLDSFLNKIPWKKDLQISQIYHGILTGGSSSYKSNTADFVKVNLTERLGFLCRRFKENRNVILHGEETEYADVLNSFLNFSALLEVLLTIKEYQNLIITNFRITQLV